MLAMSGHPANTQIPSEITLHRQSRVLELRYEDGSHFELPAEYLRVYSPSAEVRGHGAGQEVLQTGKRQVELVGIEPVGNYAVKLVFSDGHDSGLYSWDTLYDLGRHHSQLWANYLEALEKAGASRDIDSTTPPPAAGGCGKH